MPPKKSTVAAPAAAPSPAKTKKTSSKHKIVAVVTSDGIQGSFQQESAPKKPIIVHLPIQSHTVHFHEQPINYDPNPPGDCIAYNDGMLNPFEEDCDIFENAVVNDEKRPEDNDRRIEITKIKEILNTSVVQAPVQEKKVEKQTAPLKHAKEYGPTKLMIVYENTKVTKELPDNTNIACFWTCEKFEGRPCIIPMYIIDGVWYGYGNYCRPQTALAALLAEPMDTHIRWERIALLHMLYGSHFSQGRVYPAPHFSVLDRFGGPMNIDEYLDLCDRGRLRVDIHYPPMVSILASMDTKPIDFYESSLSHTTASHAEPVNVGHQGSSAQLKLKRSKPLKDREHTLDNILNLQIKNR